MEIETATCSQCGHEKDVCGECGSTHVTPVDYVGGDATSRHGGVRSNVLAADDGDTLTVVQVCWNCGAECKRVLSVAVHHGEGSEGT